MDREQPNFNVFLQPSTFIKPNSKSSDKKKQVKSPSLSSTQSQQYHSSQVLELPETEFPTTQNPVLFYKVKERLTSDMFTSRIGYRMRQFSRVEQDYISYLTQLLMTECNWLKIFIIEPNYLYFQINSVSTDKDSSSNSNENQKQQVILENKILRLLKDISEVVFNPWIQTNLQPQRLTSPDFQEEIFINSFQKEVIAKVKQMYQKTFVDSRKN